MGGGINPIIKKLNKKNVITSRNTYNCRYSRRSRANENI
jgi:hypothetical protein